MLVGIIDMDLFINKRTFLPNPEVMLYSAYHKKNRDIVHLLLNGQNIDIYEKIYIFRTKLGKVKFPEELYSKSNVTCRGSYFTNGIVAPIPEEVFACEPDKSIYDKYCKYWEGGKLINGVVTYRRAKYGSYRKNSMYFSGAGTNNIYDYDLGSEEDYLGFMKLYEEGKFKKLHFFFPIQCDNLELALKWANAPFMTSQVKIWYLNTVSWAEISTIKKAKLRIPIIAYLTNKKRFSNQKEYDDLLIELLDTVLYCIINSVNVQFKFNPQIKQTEQFRILTRISNWSCSKIQPSFYEFCTKKDQSQIDCFILSHPEVKDWFYIKPHEFKNNGGVWVHGRKQR